MLTPQACPLHVAAHPLGSAEPVASRFWKELLR